MPNEVDERNEDFMLQCKNHAIKHIIITTVSTRVTNYDSATQAQ
jgi:hypothetical protein